MFSFEPYEDGIRLTGYEGEETDLLIPEAMEGKKVRCLGKRMFFDHGMALERVVVPEGVKVIEEACFEGCFALHELVLSESLEFLGREFAAMTDLETVHVPAGVSQMEGIGVMEPDLDIDEANPYYFSDGYGIYHKAEDGYELCGVSGHHQEERYAVKEGTVTIRTEAFHNASSLKHVILPASLKEIEENALQASGLGMMARRNAMVFEAHDNDHVFLVDGSLLQKKEDGLELVLYGGHDVHLSVPSDITEIGTGACRCCGIESLVINETVKRIHPDAFYGNPMKEAWIDGYHLLFPRSGTVLGPDLVGGFGRNGKRYDIEEYDRKLSVGLITADRVRMMVHRLLEPKDMKEEHAEAFRAILKEHLEECVKESAALDDADSVQGMLDLDIIQTEAIDACLRICEEAGSRECTARIIKASSGQQEDSFEL